MEEAFRTTRLALGLRTYIYSSHQAMYHTPCVRAQGRRNPDVYVRTYMYTYIHMYVRTYVHTYVHMYKIWCVIGTPKLIRSEMAWISLEKLGKHTQVDHIHKLSQSNVSNQRNKSDSAQMLNFQGETERRLPLVLYLNLKPLRNTIGTTKRRPTIND